MANNNINIVISLKNQASGPLNQVRKDIRNFGSELVMFNRRLFTATAVYATFTGVFAKAFDFAHIGADFDYFRQQFNNTFGSGYLKELRIASNGTADALGIMQVAVRNHIRGFSAAETKQIFTLSAVAAKRTGKSTVQAANEMSVALQTLSASTLKTFLISLAANNQFHNMNTIIGKITHGLNAAGMKADVFRRTVLRELTIAFAEEAAAAGDAKSLFMQWGAGIESVRQVIGTFLSRALAPFIGMMARLAWGIFDKFNDILDETNQKVKGLREGLIDFVAMGGGIMATLVGIVGGMSMLALITSTLGIPFGTIVGLMTMFYLGMKKATDESGSFLQAMADIGTTLKFWYESFTTYSSKTGKSIISGSVMERLNKMSEGTRNSIVTIGKAFALAKVGVMGFADGLQKVYDLATKMLTTFGLLDGKTQQFTQRGESLIKYLGMGTGALVAGWTLKKVLGLIPGINKLPGMGNGDKSGFFSRGTLLNPMIVKDIGSVGNMLGAATTGMGAWFARAIPFLARALPLLPLLLLQGDNKPTRDYDKDFGKGYVAKSDEFYKLLDQMKAQGGEISQEEKNLMNKEGILNLVELTELVAGISDFLQLHRPNKFVSTKSNNIDQIK